MTEKRDLNLDRYNISKYRYRELANFCLQYPEMIAEREACYGVGAQVMSGMPHSGNISDPTATKGERAYKLSKDIDLIVQTAAQAAGLKYEYIIKAVTENKTWDDLRPPLCSRREFNEARRRFFYLLSLRK